MSRLWILISYLSQVLEPSPQGLIISINISKTEVDRRLSGGVLEDLGWESDRSLDSEILVLGPVDQIATELL